MRNRFWIGLLFFTIGLACLAAAAAVEAYNANWAASTVAVPGTVVSLRDTGNGTAAPVIQYRVHGQDVIWLSHSGSSPPSYAVGEHVTMLVQRDNPNDATIDAFFSRHLPALFLGLFGIVFAGIGGPLAFLGRISPARRADLLAHGTPLRADIVAVRLDPQESEAIWHIHAQALDPTTRVVRTFRSEPLRFDPAPFIGTRRQVDVRIDPAKPSRFAMDLSWLPKAG